ncbi:MAG: 3' terminal RNA ribose 2'-O-methyltransferase Hen1 [Propionibacteriaceae bacterium]
MLVTLSAAASASMPDATDLGYLVHKHPDKVQAFDTAVGTAHVFWPEASADRSTVALLLEVDPIGLVRRRPGGSGSFALSQYVNDRPYAASSMVSVALGKVFRTALSGRCHARPELAVLPLPLEVHVPALPSRGGPELVERLFAPLGWTPTATPIPLDPELPAWGPSPYVDLRLSGTLTVADALTQLYVLIPVLDDGKHYWVSTDEFDKLLRAGGDWLARHPERDLITRRYLGHHQTLVQDAVGRLAEVDDTEPSAPAERPSTPLAALRTAAVLAALRAEGASTVVDLGCGEGALLRELIGDPTYRTVLGVDVSHRALEVAERRLQLDRMPDSRRVRLRLIQSSATYRDDRLTGYDAVVLMEVIEHLDLTRLPALVRSVFGHARPTTVVVTTPNTEHNVCFPSLPAGALRHRDHRFEWTRAEFGDWAQATAAATGYTVRHVPVGDDDPEVGPPTQLAVFRRAA